MVFKYKRKSNRGAWSEESLKRAMKAVKENGKSIKSTATEFGIPFTTLYRHLKAGNTSKKLGRFTTIFSPEQEKELCAYLTKLDSLFFGLTRSDFLELVYQYAAKNNIAHPFKNGKAGDDWFSGFKSRHPEIVLRSPEPTSLARTRGFNRPQVDLFYTNYWDLLEKHNFDATTIYNMDETGIKSSTTKPPKVLSVKGKKQVGVISSAERGQLTTVICCCNAAGTFIPPFFIFARKRMQERLLDGAPPGSQATVTVNGWIHGEAFLSWLQFFTEKVRPNEDRKVLLLLDNHESHKYYPALEFASKNNIVFLSFAPHTTDRMQPLDVAVYGPLKRYFEQELNTFQKSHPGRIVNQYDIAKLFSGAYVKSASVQNATSGFNRPGLWPYNPNVFGDEDFAPSMMTDRPINDESSNTADALSTASSHPVNDATPKISDARSTIVVPSINGATSTMTNAPLTMDDCHSTPTNSNDCPIDISLISTLQQIRPEIIIEMEPERSTTPVSERDIPQNRESANSPSENNPLHEVKRSLTPLQIRPIPTMAAPKTNRKHKRQKSEVLTSSPVKAQQAEKFKKAIDKKTQISGLAGSSKTTHKKTNISKLPGPGKSTNKKIKTSKTEESCLCLVCSEEYIEPPTEDWIECNQCKRWAHEDCTSYSGVGSYFCDECDD